MVKTRPSDIPQDLKRSIILKTIRLKRQAAPWLAEMRTIAGPSQPYSRSQLGWVWDFMLAVATTRHVVLKCRQHRQQGPRHGPPQYSHYFTMLLADLFGKPDLDGWNLTQTQRCRRTSPRRKLYHAQTVMHTSQLVTPDQLPAFMSTSCSVVDNAAPCLIFPLDIDQSRLAATLVKWASL